MPRPLPPQSFVSIPNQIRPTLRVVAMATLIGGTCLVVPLRTADGHPHGRDMVAAARALLASLDAAQREAVSYAFDNPHRHEWHFIPKERAGLSLKEMSTPQRQLTYVLLNSALSHHGFREAVTIMTLEQILYDMENQSPTRDPEKYHLFFFGKPETKGTWGWRIEGHHLSVNFTLVDAHVVSTTPSFFGSNPAHVKVGPRKGLRVLGREETLGRKLAASLSETQRASGILSGDVPEDVIIGPGREAAEVKPLGIAYTQLGEQQQTRLKSLVRSHLNRLRAPLAKETEQRIDGAGWDNVHFAWAGKLEEGAGHYYRVQGPTFILEYDNTQNNANHVHTVWRDMTNDFGEDILQRHYETAHQ